MDKFRLQYEMKKRNVTVDILCKAINISKSAFYRKCSGQTEFTLGEINSIVEFLGLPSPMDIFFADKVSEKTQ